MKNSTMFDRITEIQARAAAATASPWIASIEGKDHDSGSSCILQPVGGIDLDGATDSDVEFMAHARQDIPYLLAEIERLQALLARPER